MESGGGCPPWIDPGSAFRLVVHVDSYVAEDDSGVVNMAEQQHDIWFDRSSPYSLAKFHEDLSTKIYWGPSQSPAIWVIDKDSASQLKLRRNEYVHQMIKDRWEQRVAFLNVEIERKGVVNDTASSAASRGRCVSGVTNGGSGEPSNVEGCGDTCSSPSLANEQPLAVDWATLTIQENPDDDGLATQVVDEQHLYVAMGFLQAEAVAQEEAARQGVPIPTMTAEMRADMAAAAVNVDDTTDEEPLYEWDRDNPDLSVGTCYPSMYELRLAVRQHAILKEFELDIEHSDKERFRGCCAILGCEWIMRARTQHDGSVRIQINKREHTCPSTQRVVSRMASIGWVAERAIPMLKQNPSMRACEVKKALFNKYNNLDVPYQTVYNGTKRASDKLFGKWSDSFDWLYRFKAEVELRSPGSVIEIDTIIDEDGLVRFTRFFCAFKASIDGFLNGCRPYISVDSTALNGLWNGHMPAALALDGHNWMFPVAFGFFESESKDNWIWFMEQLKKAIGPMDKLAICTDACKGLESAVKIVFPLAEKRECFRHLMENMKKYYSGDVYGKNMWPAARTYTPHKYNYFFGKVIAASPSVQKWLDEHHPFLWTRSKFCDDIKCDYINNNLAETWNSWIKDTKDLPVHCMVDAIRERIMILFGKRRQISTALTGGILPAIIHQLNAASRGLGHLKVSKGHPHQAEVSEVYKDEEVRRHVVYLPQKKCTCRQWQVTGKPCPHALTVITSMRNPDMGSFVDNYYSVAKFRAAYAGIIPSITDRSQWPEDKKGFKVHPPVQKKREPGPIRKNRIKPAREGDKATRQVRCPECKEYGHRKGNWKCPLSGTKKRKRERKTKTKVGRRKKAKTGTDVNPTLTPRTRGALAREAATKAIREAEEAELKAVAAREAAQAAAREELEANRNEYEAIFALEDVPQTSNLSPSARRALFPQDELPNEYVPKKMTPRRKQLATKKKANKKGGKDK